MSQKRRRRCLHCNELYRPDPRTLDRQRHCSAPECRRASKAKAQARWRAKSENRDYFKGPEQVARVRRWRDAHPGYWRRCPLPDDTLQEECSTQTSGGQQDRPELSLDALQDDLWTQPTVIVGLISDLTGSVLQDDMAGTLRKLHTRGLHVLGKVPGTQPQGPHEAQKTPTTRPAAPSAGAVQLAGSPSGP